MKKIMSVIMGLVIWQGALNSQFYNKEVRLVDIGNGEPLVAEQKVIEFDSTGNKTIRWAEVDPFSSEIKFIYSQAIRELSHTPNKESK